MSRGSGGAAFISGGNSSDVRSVDRSVGWSVGWSVGRSVGRFVGLVGRWVDRSVGRVGRSIACNYSAALPIFSAVAYVSLYPVGNTVSNYSAAGPLITPPWC